MFNLNDKVGIQMNKNFNIHILKARGFKNLDFQKNDCRNFINKSRHLRLSKGDGESLIEYFERSWDINDGFIFIMGLFLLWMWIMSIGLEMCFRLLRKVERHMSILVMLLFLIRRT